MVGRLLKRGEHHHTVLHLRHAESSDSQNLALYEAVLEEDQGGSQRFSYLVGHDVSEKHDVPRVNAHTMT